MPRERNFYVPCTGVCSKKKRGPWSPNGCLLFCPLSFNCPAPSPRVESTWDNSEEQNFGWARRHTKHSREPKGSNLNVNKSKLGERHVISAGIAISEKSRPLQSGCFINQHLGYRTGRFTVTQKCDFLQALNSLHLFYCCKGNQSVGNTNRCIQSSRNR